MPCIARVQRHPFHSSRPATTIAASNQWSKAMSNRPDDSHDRTADNVRTAPRAAPAA
jgi:hypothetical protein